MGISYGEILRTTFLEVVKFYDEQSSLQSRVVLKEVERRLRDGGQPVPDVAILDFFGDLFRVGYLCWGSDLLNAHPPFMHVTSAGRAALEHLSRDPANPDGYLGHLQKECPVAQIVESYIREGLAAYNAGCPRASAVMVGAASERVILDLRERLVVRIENDHEVVPKKLRDWRIKVVLDEIERYIRAGRSGMDRALFEEFDAHWNSFTGQIRLARNSAGHPSDISSVDEGRAQAALLIFPELARLAQRLDAWVSSDTR